MWRSMDGQEKLRSDLKFVDSISAFLAIIGTILEMADQELLFQKTATKPRYHLTTTNIGLRAVITVTTIILGNNIYIAN